MKKSKVLFLKDVDGVGSWESNNYLITNDKDPNQGGENGYSVYERRDGILSSFLDEWKLLKKFDFKNNGKNRRSAIKYLKQKERIDRVVLGDFNVEKKLKLQHNKGEIKLIE